MSGAPVCEGYFPDGSIQVTMTISPDNDTSLVFTDSRGLGILSRQICDGQSLDTYSVYDEFGDLRFVLQPMYQQDSSLVHYSFEYRYDSMDRLTYYRIPGATSSAPVTRYWYDCGGHLTFTQDSRQRSSTVESFTFMLYDFMGREVLSGECSAADTSGVKQHNYIADYTGGEQGTICETGYTVGQMQQPFSNAELHKATYYDKYSFLCRTGFSNRDVFPLASISAAGLPAGEISAVTGDPFTTGYGTRLYRAFYYDAKGRVQKTVSSNIKGGYQIENTSWSFSDKPIQESITISGNGITSLTETLTYTYDGADRLTSMTHKIGNAIPETILERTYDEKGRIETEQFGGLVATKRQYDYNIRNQLTGIGSFRFSQNLYYCDLFLIGGDHQRRYGPDPSAMTWSAGSGAAGNVVRGYDFRYDHAGRLKSSIYSEGWTNNVGAYNETVNSYDLNGNIGSFSRTGQNTFFNSEGNRIISRNTFSALRTDYTYDRNGNLKSDANKGINNIEYTWQNLPCRITFSNGTTICYLYSADGEKLKENSVFYLGNKIYDSNTLRMIRTDTGYVTLSGSTPTYHYYQRDSQGGNRVVMLSDGTVEQVNTWFPSGYPIGALSTSASLQAFKYSGKEYDTVRDLNLYDFGARMYDPENRVWNSPDPLAGKYANNSPYAFCAGNPVRYVDVDGESTYVVNCGNGRYRVDGGDLHDGDLNIYVVTKNKDGSKIKGKSIGKSLFITSFYISDKKKWAKNSIIDINDSSGNEYLQEIIQNPPPLFNDFIPNAGNGKYYDFKERNKDNRIDNHCWHYRGMPINIFTDGQIRYVSARDVGNIAAGYMAAINGMPWLATRMAFDAYQSYTDNRLSIEGISSKTPQLFGWLFGKQSLSFQERINMLISSIRAVINNPNVLYSHED